MRAARADSFRADGYFRRLQDDRPAGAHDGQSSRSRVAVM
jgi:hypothetical protein